MYYLTDADYAVAASNGISRNLAHHRYYDYGYDAERAITEPVGSCKRVTPNMILWDEWKEVAESNGISRQNFFNRMNIKYRRKWTPEEAATHPLGVKRNAVVDPRIYALAEKNGIKISTLRTRIFSQHWNHHRAATEPVHSYREGVLC